MKHYTKKTIKQAGDSPFEIYRKISMTRAKRITGQFDVETKEGVVMCLDGWLALDDMDNPYPIAAEIFDMSYQDVEAPAAERMKRHVDEGDLQCRGAR
jgi:hypothetical protein